MRKSRWPLWELFVRIHLVLILLPASVLFFGAVLGNEMMVLVSSAGVLGGIFAAIINYVVTDWDDDT